MNFKQIESVVCSLELSDSRLIDHIPYLYQDFLEINSHSQYMLDLLELDEALDSSNVILDLCCAKGASLISIVNKYRCRGVGVDINSHFIGDAKIEAFQHHVKDLVSFVEQDIAAFIKETGEKFDLIIFPNVSQILGDLIETLNSLAELLKEDGSILLESQYKSYEFDFATSEHKKDEDIEHAIINSSLHTKQKHVWDHFDHAKLYEADLDKLRNRVEELLQRKPDLSFELNAFIAQKEKTAKQLQENITSKATWQLTKVTAQLI